jgi:hypothetical protein
VRVATLIPNLSANSSGETKFASIPCWLSICVHPRPSSTPAPSLATRSFAFAAQYTHKDGQVTRSNRSTLARLASIHQRAPVFLITQNETNSETGHSPDVGTQAHFGKIVEAQPAFCAIGSQVLIILWQKTSCPPSNLTVPLPTKPVAVSNCSSSACLRRSGSEVLTTEDISRYWPRFRLRLRCVDYDSSRIDGIQISPSLRI